MAVAMLHVLFQFKSLHLLQEIPSTSETEAQATALTGLTLAILYLLHFKEELPIILQMVPILPTPLMIL
jgi:hypothetical protein